MASTDELIPGFHFTTYGHSFVLFHTEILDDMRLLDYVLQIDSCDPHSFQPFRSGKPCPANIREGAPMLRIQPLPDRASTVAGANRFSPASHAACPPDRHSGKTVRRSAHRGWAKFLTGQVVRPGRAEPGMAVAARRAVAVEVGRSVVSRWREERPAAQHTEGTFCGTCRVNNQAGGWVRSEPVLAPIPNVAVHVVQAPTVARFSPRPPALSNSSCQRARRIGQGGKHRDQSDTWLSPRRGRRIPTRLLSAGDTPHLPVRSASGKTGPRCSSSLL